MFLDLSPEASRLRRVARACAAGEISRREYRRTRRELILTMQGVADVQDCTERRYDGEATLRRVAPTATTTRDRAGWSRRLLWWLLGAVLAVLVPVAVLAAEPNRVPPAAERNPDPALSKTLTVAQVVVPLDAFGVGELPGVTRVALQAMLDRALQDAQSSNAVRADGFTRGELEQIGRFLNAVGVHDAATRMTSRDLDDLVALVQRQKRQRGVSLVQLEAIAAEMQAWLRQRGYPLASVYLPTQEVQDGRVELAVQVGRLSDLRLAGAAADDSSAGTLARRYGFSDLLGQPVHRRTLETRLNVMNSLGARSLQAGFEPGAAVGDSRMVLHVGDQPALRAFVEGDNFGVRPDAQERLSGGVSMVDVLREGDVLAVRATAETGSPGQLFGIVGYSRPIRSGRLNVHGTVAHTRLTDVTGREGRGWLAEVMLEDTWLFTRQHKQQGRYGLGWHDADLTAEPGAEGAEEVIYGRAQFDWHRRWDRAKVAIDGTVELRLGHVDGATAAAGEFWRLHADATAWTLVRLPLIGTRAKWIMAPRVQTGTKALPATLSFNASDPARGTSLPAGSLLLDEGLAVMSALRFAAPVGEWWAYGEFVYGEVGRLRQWYQLTTVGLGWEARFAGKLRSGWRSRVTLAYPIAHQSDGVFDDDGLQLFWSLRYDH